MRTFNTRLSHSLIWTKTIGKIELTNMMSSPEQNTSCDDLQVTHYLICGSIHICQSCELHIVVHKINQRRNGIQADTFPVCCNRGWLWWLRLPPQKICTHHKLHTTSIISKQSQKYRRMEVNLSLALCAILDSESLSILHADRSN